MRACATCSAWRAWRSPPTRPAAWTSTRWPRCCAPAGSARSSPPLGTTGWAPWTPSTHRRRWPGSTACASTWTPPTVASSAWSPTTRRGVAAAPFAAVRRADSVVVDPHKHGLQPYGCGAVLFSDPTVGRFYAHDSPYTYFTSDELHLGRSPRVLPCRRRGGGAVADAAGAPAHPRWLGAVLRPGLRPRSVGGAAGRLGRAGRLPAAAAGHRDLPAPVGDAERGGSGEHADHGPRHDRRRPGLPRHHRGDGPDLARRVPDIDADLPTGRILRSVLMKPEHGPWLDELPRPGRGARVSGQDQRLTCCRSLRRTRTSAQHDVAIAQTARISPSEG